VQYHLGNEELLVVLSGKPTLRTPDGVHEVFFLRDAVDFWEGEEPPEPEE
jgi:hypothetical protein